jgi:acetyl-CoA acyltransferase 2
MTTRLPGIVFLAAKRTPFGTFNGALKKLTATDLGVIASKAAIEASDLEASDIDHVYFGNVLQTARDAIYLARHVGLKSGLPIKVPALTLNRLCGSGFEAITAGAREIMTGGADVVLVGGSESMSQAPHVVRGGRDGFAFGRTPELEDSLWSCLTDTFTGLPMAITAENLAEKYEVSRAECDAYAVESQTRWQKGNSDGAFAAEITPVTIPNRKGDITVDTDEHPRAGSTVEGMGKLRPVFKKDGVVTAGNASGICDGAAALIIANEDVAAQKGWATIGRLVSWGVSGCDPEIMGIGPVPASKIALEKAGLTVADMDLIEVNEAFAPQYLAVEKALELPREKTNVNGGAIALGHPLAASGARITAHLLHELRRNGGRYGLGTACIGGGQGIAVIVEVS